jgi:hypothetical protein
MSELDKNAPQVPAGSQAGGYLPQSFDPNQQAPPMPSPPTQTYSSPDPSLAGHPGYPPSSNTPSQYGAVPLYGAPPSQYGTPGQNYGAPVPPGPTYGGAPGQTQSAYGAPQNWGYGQQQGPAYGVQQPQAMGPPAAAPAAGAGAGAAAPKARICGLPKTIFIIVLITAIILVLGALGAGLGVGLSNMNRNSNTGSASSTSDDDPTPTFSFDPDDPEESDPATSAIGPSRTTTPTTTTTPSRTTPVVSSTPTATITHDDVSCPADDNTYYAISATAQFRVLCNVIITGTFLHSNHTTNMGECMTACREDSSCTGALWWFSDSIQANCDMYWNLDEDDPVSTTIDVAFGAYDWIWDLRRRTVKRDGVVETLGEA